VQIPFERTNFEKHFRRPFGKWLIAKGAELRDPTNEWEVMRYALDGTVSIIYAKKRGMLNYTGDSFAHIQDFLDSQPITRRWVCPGPNLMTIPKGSSIADIMKGWGSATDTAREPAIHSQEPQGGDEPSSDHHSDVPWE
jgi:hypothetical protein